MKRADVYAKVAARVLEQLSQGVVPWHKPWVGGGPVSIHGHRYRGVNALTLGLSEYSSPVWLTYNQARERGGHVRRGEKGTPVLLFKVSQREDEIEGASSRRFFATTFTVFNLEQCEGVELPARFRERPAPVAAGAIASRYLECGGPRLQHGGEVAAYAPSTDLVVMPAPSAFESVEAYYSTLFHEFGHSTGHPSRLNREGIANPDGFGSHRYSTEELVAEMCAAFLCARAGIETERTTANTVGYIQHWLGVLQADPGVLVKAASSAQKAADWVLGEGEHQSVEADAA